jgi:hypothetical protein
MGVSFMRKKLMLTLAITLLLLNVLNVHITHTNSNTSPSILLADGTDPDPKRDSVIFPTA